MAIDIITSDKQNALRIMGHLSFGILTRHAALIGTWVDRFRVFNLSVEYSRVKA
jgi:hypothetical protein